MLYYVVCYSTINDEDPPLLGSKIYPWGLSTLKDYYHIPLSLYTIESGVRTIAEEPLTVHPKDFLSDCTVELEPKESDFRSSAPKCTAWKSFDEVWRADFFVASRSRWMCCGSSSSSSSRILAWSCTFCDTCFRSLPFPASRAATADGLYHQSSSNLYWKF